MKNETVRCLFRIIDYRGNVRKLNLQMRGKNVLDKLIISKHFGGSPRGAVVNVLGCVSIVSKSAQKYFTRYEQRMLRRDEEKVIQIDQRRVGVCIEHNIKNILFFEDVGKIIQKCNACIKHSISHIVILLSICH